MDDNVNDIVQAKTLIEADLHLLIPLPTEISRGVGLESCYGPHGVHIIFRGLDWEREKLNDAANLLGLTLSTFCRRVLNDASDLVLKMHHEKVIPLERYKAPKIGEEDGNARPKTRTRTRTRTPRDGRSVRDAGTEGSGTGDPSGGDPTGD